MADNAQWYVLHTYSGYENTVQTSIFKARENRHMEDMILDVNIPMETVTEIEDGKTVVKERKTFPGYVLVKMILTNESWQVVRNVRGVTGFVGSDGKAIPLTEQEILVVVFGGVLLGVGVGLILRYGGCLDGTEIVAMLLSHHTEFSVGQIVLFFNIIIYAVAGLLFGPDRALYSLLTYFITSKVIDIVENGMEQGKSVMIITDHGKDIADKIYSQLGRTCTQMEGKGMVSNGKKTVLYCVITRVEVPAIKKIINDADVSAFMTISDVSEIVGNHIKKKKAPAH